jgi:hypothetical protein
MPSTPKPAGVRLFATDNVAVSMSPFTGQQQVYRHQGMAWRAEITLPIMDRATADPWRAFLLALGGRFGTFTMGDPSAPAPRGVGTGAPLVNGAAQTGQSLITDGWTISTANILRAGDYVQLGSYLYLNINDVSSNASGQATLDIWPRLRASPADNAAIVVNNTVGLWRLATNERGWTVSPGNLYHGITFGAIEAI